MLKSPVRDGRGFLRVGAESAGRIGTPGQNLRAEAEPAGRDRIGGQRRNRRAGEHQRAGWAVRCGHPDCGHADDALIRTLSYGHPCATPSYVCPCATLSYGHPSTTRHMCTLAEHSHTGPMCDILVRVPMCDTLIRASCTTLHIRASAHGTPPPSGITGRGGARSGSPSALSLCPRPCLFPCRGCGRRTIRSGGSAARAAAARSRAGASAGRPA